MALKAGELVGNDYRIVRPLATGGMGTVYVAEQLSTGRRRALKLMAPALVADEKSRQRFVEEARIGSQIDSVHVVEVIGAGIDDERPWLAMELLEGENLDDHVEKHGPLPLAQVVDVFEQLAHALEQAHSQGIIHRDLKPANLFLARSRQRGAQAVLKILDFGIASFIARNETAATATSAIGSPLWLAPEQISVGAKLRPSTDVWSLGLIGFYLLTGKYYWRAANAVPFDLHPLIAEIVVSTLVPASERAAELGAPAPPPGFDAWFTRCVARDPNGRFQSAQPVAEAIAELGRASSSATESAAAPRGSTVRLSPAPSGTLRLPDDAAPGSVAQTQPLPPDEPVAPTMALPETTPSPRRGYAIGAAVILLGAAAAAAAGFALGGDGARESEQVRRQARDEALPDASAASPLEPTVTFTSAFGGELVVDGEVVGAITSNEPRTYRIAIGSHSAQVRGATPRLAGVVFAEQRFDAAEGSTVSFPTPCPEDTAFVPASPRGFCIDRTEVTVSEVAAAVRAGRCDPPGDARGDDCNWREAALRGEHPMNCVSFDEASAFCGAAEGRLPSPEEWTRAARAIGAAAYPWGDEPPDDTRLRWSGTRGDGSIGGTSVAGSHRAGASPFGVEDMAGNVMEWTSSAGERRVIRGGSWADADPQRVRIDAETPVPTETRSPGLGFRCVRDVGSAAPPDRGRSAPRLAEDESEMDLSRSIEAHRAEGDVDRALVEMGAYLREYPDGPHAARYRSVLEESAP